VTSDLVAPVELTFLFTDMEASTRAWDLDMAAMDEAQRRHDGILRQAISAHCGRIFSTAGDGVAAAFRKADEAVAAAVDAQRSLLEERWPTMAPVRVRMGLHTGSAIERDGDYFGPTVIRAARLMSLVEGGRIICSTATKAALPTALEADVQLLPVGTVQLKGLSTPEAALAIRAPGLPEAGAPVDHARPTWRRPNVDSSLIARDALVGDVAAQVSAGALVTLVGVGGVGKTRLATAVADRIGPSLDEQVGWIDLTAVSDASAVVHELATLFGVRAQRDEDLVEKLALAIGEREVALVFDNCEHVLDAVRPLATVLLERCPGAALVATSRERIGAPGERVVTVPPLRPATNDRRRSSCSSSASASGARTSMTTSWRCWWRSQVAWTASRWRSSSWPLAVGGSGSWTSVGASPDASASSLTPVDRRGTRRSTARSTGPTPCSARPSRRCSGRSPSSARRSTSTGSRRSPAASTSTRSSRRCSTSRCSSATAGGSGSSS